MLCNVQSETRRWRFIELTLHRSAERVSDLHAVAGDDLHSSVLNREKFI